MEQISYPVSLLVEGPTDEAVVRRILAYVGLPCGAVYGKKGKDDLLRRLPRYNRAARFAPWLAVVDLDREPECAPLLVRSVLPDPAPAMNLRVAVRAIESWLLADAERMARFLSIPAKRIPADPDALADPKAFLVNLARHSQRRAIREEMVPRAGSGARVGPGYTRRIIEFVNAEDGWRPKVAERHSDSLRRCVACLRALKEWRPDF